MPDAKTVGFWEVSVRKPLGRKSQDVTFWTGIRETSPQTDEHVDPRSSPVARADRSGLIRAREWRRAAPPRAYRQVRIPRVSLPLYPGLRPTESADAAANRCVAAR